ncbi:DUF4328 domain-containing protein [Eikenella corrodens]|uniref:DUF4328 domain-containing protein n=1 Tax=Eikenella corrodens TaxID=539 RepID=A0A3S9SHA2_EIKCO|nr:DUF4328 domain-containing protein [Eikenella corrodens]AZR58892.1 DUF4328 domain-containing protein [Eikenella corrodens]
MTKRQREYTFRSNDSRTQLVQLLAALVCLSQLSGWLLMTGMALLKVLGWLELSAGESNSLAGVAELATWVLTGLLLCSGLVFLCWLYRAACNARALGAQGMQVSPAWAVGGFFVPIIHLFLPYQAVKEIWVNGPVDSEPDSIWLKIWWFCLLGSMALSRFADMSAGWETQSGEWGARLLLFTLSAWLTAASAYALLRLVGEINRRQNDWLGNRVFR